ncbi:APC membrane recruitment protein 3 [Pseudophryne corroboree]|uniref:APC membrane recruitment protein 3 n=1 Tax=Pseudophryne corroboree TaxID=495146 RepID=UPI0030819FA1
MELIRGKTFIKSYAQNRPEKIRPTGGKEKKNAELRKNINECYIKKNDAQRMSNNICTKEADDKIHCPKFTRSRSRPHDCSLGEDKPEKSLGHSVQGKLSSSVSSPGLVEDPGGKRNNIHFSRQPTCKQTMIDYRNFVPQMPFVPTVAKSLPRKRISLRRSKKSLKNIFNLKKNKQQDAISEGEMLQPVIFKLKEERTDNTEHRLDIAEISSDDFLAPEFPDREMYIDTINPFKALCEDVTSLKSFDSFTGCGEIFADECSSFIDIENSRVTFISKPSSLAASFQGGVERLASPAKSESIDVSRLRGHINSSAMKLCTNVLSETKSLPDSNALIKEKTTDNMSRDQVSNSSFNDLMSSSENINDLESPVSTSDEGYYDSYSPGLEEDRKEAGAPRPLPRDSYSGDALYELFWDSCKTKPWSAQDCDLSVSGHNTNNSKSIYSFCVGSQENLTPQSAKDLNEDSALQSTWKGRECLLKLCDTELSLTIGMVNWLKNNGKIHESETNDISLTDNSKEPVEEPQLNDGNTEIEMSTMTRDSKDQITSQWECCQKEPGFIRNHIADSINTLDDIIVAGTTYSTFTEITAINCIPEISKHEEHLEKPPVLKSSTTISEYKHDLELFSPHSNTIVPRAFPHKLSGTEVLPSYTHLNSLQSLGLQYFTWTKSENDRCLIKILEKCTAQMSSLHITFGNRSTLYNPCKIMRPYEIAQNFKNSVDQHEKGTPDIPLQQASLSDVHTKKLKSDIDEQPLPNKMCEKNSKYEYISNLQCILKNFKETQTSKVASRPNFQEFFKSPCSSVISRCSSVLYKVHNLEDKIIFFNTRKYNNQSPNGNDDFTPDSGASSIDIYNTDRMTFSP